MRMAPSTFTQAVSMGTIRSVDMAMLCRLLDLDAETRAALNGCKTRCRYERKE